MLNQRCDEMKVMRDPVHEYIHIEYQVIWDVINSREFQRLRRIHQTGTSFLVYHTAEHSRFSHSLGVYEIVRRMISEVKSLSEALSEDEKIQVMLAGLVHDLGHGPFSHFFESVTEISHETMTAHILLGTSDVHSVLKSYDDSLPDVLVSILSHTHPNSILSSIISGQLDADRMDYLLRDAMFTGTSYGQFDLGRILRTLRVVDQRLVIKESGVHSVEDYIMARYHMYWQVYYHPTSRSVEAILSGFFQRLKDLLKDNAERLKQYPMFCLLNPDDALDIEAHHRLDESACIYGFQCALDDEDDILRDFARRMLERDIFVYEDVRDEAQVETLKTALMTAGFDPTYYLYQDRAEKRPYSPYDEASGLIYILRTDGSIQELSNVSTIVSSIARGQAKSERKMFYPKEMRPS
jgi:HD superfamily phosphohydrolase